MRNSALLIIFSLVFAAASQATEKVAIGSKAFTESVILGEIARELAADAGANATHQRQLGGTRVLWNALVRGEIDVYPEYTGTIGQEIFAGNRPRTKRPCATRWRSPVSR